MRLDLSRMIEAPAEVVWLELTDWDRIERAAAARGARLVRTGAERGIEVGSGWRGTAEILGRVLEADVTLTGLVPPARIVAAGDIGGIDAGLVVDLTPVAPARTRLEMVLDLRAATLSGRLILQAVKLARGRLSARLEDALADLGDRAESR